MERHSINVHTSYIAQVKRKIVAFANHLGASIYMSVADYLKVKRESGSLYGVSSIILDLDTYRSAYEYDSDGEILQAMRPVIDRIGIEPNMYVNSGHGRYLVFSFNNINLSVPSMRKLYQETVKKLIFHFKEFGADSKCSDITRVFRIPGNINPKTGGKAYVVEWFGNRATLSELAEAVGICKGHNASEKKKKSRQRNYVEIGMQLGDSPQKDLEKWLKKAALVEEYYHKNGTLSMPNTTLFPDGSNMFQWVQHQKKQQKNGRLSPYQKDRLEKMGIQWIKQEPDWEEGYRHAEQYFEENGHLFVPSRYASPDDFKLGHWIEKQRKRYFGKSKNKMSDEQVGMLEDICMYWEDLENAEWGWSVGLLREFIKITPKPFVINRDCRYKNYPLGEFVSEVIEQYLKDTLSDEKVEELLSIGFNFRRKIE